jgi:hypothetical protein
VNENGQKIQKVFFFFLLLVSEAKNYGNLRRWLFRGFCFRVFSTFLAFSSEERNFYEKTIESPPLGILASSLFQMLTPTDKLIFKWKNILCEKPLKKVL